MASNACIVFHVLLVKPYHADGSVVPQGPVAFLGDNPWLPLYDVEAIVAHRWQQGTGTSRRKHRSVALELSASIWSSGLAMITGVTPGSQLHTCMTLLALLLCSMPTSAGFNWPSTSLTASRVWT